MESPSGVNESHVMVYIRMLFPLSIPFIIAGIVLVILSYKGKLKEGIFTTPDGKVPVLK